MIRKISGLGLICIAATLAGFAINGTPRAAAVPEPNIVPRSWQLDIEFHHPRSIHVVLPGESASRVYWYWTYTVTNRTGEDRNFVPEIAMLTNAGDVMAANRNIPPTVFKAIKDQLRNPLLLSPTEILGKLLQGPDHAVDGVAIWPMPAHDIDHAWIFFNGLSGETYEFMDPVTAEKHLLRKALMIEYNVPGSAQPADQPWILKRRQWVVR